MEQNNNTPIDEPKEKQEAPRKKSKKGNFISQILSGKMFRSEIFLNNIWLMLLIVFYSFIYVSNRYAYRQELKQIKQLKAERQDAKYMLLTKQSEFSEKSRQSNIESYVQRYQSQLKTATNPPFTVK
ncbi:MAG: hypothetical protein IJF46_06020 [Bacteroidaceae bacterium]|nr:hypothetical protein [Bacteroidaceae bacterium]MBR3855781.1 hypothetical protein [Bacteroidaceae bacterium]